MHGISRMLTTGQRDWVARIAIITGLVAVVVVYRMLSPYAWWMPQCPFHLLTGLQCPGCGFQRAMSALLHGHVVEAVHYNLYLVYSLPYLLLVVLNRYFLPHSLRSRLTPWVENRWVVGFYVVSFFAWLVVRNLLHI
ncbi:MAG: DUF2752 domain-containing protein [Prevotella sp.]|nr:DUF2752 domain-containing protein [Prevotella sp.]